MRQTNPLNRPASTISRDELFDHAEAHKGKLVVEPWEGRWRVTYQWGSRRGGFTITGHEDTYDAALNAVATTLARA